MLKGTTNLTDNEILEAIHRNLNLVAITKLVGMYNLTPQALCNKTRRGEEYMNRRTEGENVAFSYDKGENYVGELIIGDKDDTNWHQQFNSMLLGDTINMHTWTRFVVIPKVLPVPPSMEKAAALVDYLKEQYVQNKPMLKKTKLDDIVEELVHKYLLSNIANEGGIEVGEILKEIPQKDRKDVFDFIETFMPSGESAEVANNRRDWRRELKEAVRNNYKDLIKIVTLSKENKLELLRLPKTITDIRLGVYKNGVGLMPVQKNPYVELY